MDNRVFDTFGLVVTFFASAVVWGTLIAGLYQLVRKEVHQIRMMLQRSRLEGYSHQTS